MSLLPRFVVVCIILGVFLNQVGAWRPPAIKGANKGAQTRVDMQELFAALQETQDERSRTEPIVAAKEPDHGKNRAPSSRSGSAKMQAYMDKLHSLKLRTAAASQRLSKLRNFMNHLKEMNKTKN